MADGALRLLLEYWPVHPSLEEGVTIDTRSQRWPAADQLLFNLSGAYVTTPRVTQRVDGSHSEHAEYKRASREFVLHEWYPSWRYAGAELSNVTEALSFARRRHLV